jgi:hypothetical protein
MREPPPGFLDALLEDPEPEARPARNVWARRALSVGAVAAAIGFAFMVATPSHPGPQVTPAIATMSDAHGATASLENDPTVGAAPVAVPVTFAR